MVSYKAADWQNSRASGTPSIRKTIRAVFEILRRSLSVIESIDQTMPDAYGLLDDFNRYNGKDKLVTLFLTIGIVIILQRVQRKYSLRSILTG